MSCLKCEWVGELCQLFGVNQLIFWWKQGGALRAKRVLLTERVVFGLIVPVWNKDTFILS